MVGGEEEGLHHWDLGVEGKRFGGCDGMEPLSARMTTARRGYRRGRRRRGSHCGPPPSTGTSEDDGGEEMFVG